MPAGPPRYAEGGGGGVGQHSAAGVPATASSSVVGAIDGDHDGAMRMELPPVPSMIAPSFAQYNMSRGLDPRRKLNLGRCDLLTVKFSARYDALRSYDFAVCYPNPNPTPTPTPNLLS